MARPGIYTQTLVDDICEQLADGLSLRKICENPDMPDLRTVRRWLRDIEAFRLQYARARDEQADFYADAINDIAENVEPERNEIEKARLRTDNLKWIASKLKPRKYGEHLDLTTLGQKLPTPILGGASVAAVTKPEEK